MTTTSKNNDSVEETEAAEENPKVVRQRDGKFMKAVPDEMEENEFEELTVGAKAKRLVKNPKVMWGAFTVAVLGALVVVAKNCASEKEAAEETPEV